MNELSSPEASEDDSAWASINTPLSVDALKEFCADTERMFRINPMLEFTSWEPTSENSFRFSGRNISQKEPFDFEVELTVSEQGDEFKIEYDQGVKSSTVFKVEGTEQGSKLTITDRYDRLPAKEREAHMHEVDQSITVWAQYIQKYLVIWKRYSRYGLWRWYMRRIWQPMKPNARRITYMLLWITVVEIALIALAAAIFFTEFDRI